MPTARLPQGGGKGGGRSDKSRPGKKFSTQVGDEAGPLV